MKYVRKALVPQVGWASAILFAALLAPAAEDKSSAKPFSTRVSRYFAERVRDFADTFELHVGLGSILSADVEATQLAHLGLAGGFAYMYRVEQAAFSADVFWGFPLSNLLGDFLGKGSEGWRRFLICHAHYGGAPDADKMEEHRCALIPLLFTLHSTVISSHFGPPLPDEKPPIRWADCSAGVIAVPFALHVGLHPGEMLDFVAGWFGYDLPGADRNRYHPEHR